MEDLAFLHNASATFDDLEMNGLPSPPLAFDPAITGVAVRVDAPVYNPLTGEVLEVSNIIYERHPDGRPPDRAYWVGRKIKKTIFGVVKECTILNIRNDPNIPFEVTPAKAAVKITSWKKLREQNHIEDPKKEVAAMQLVCRSGFHHHIVAHLDALEDEEYLLLFMQFCSSGDLFGYVRQAGRFSEPMARYWLLQIIDGISHLHKLGVCHRDMSLENILVDEYRAAIIIDLGMCLRVPYNSEDEGLSVSDVTAGTLRRLITPLVPCGKPNYISPEILKSTEPFDGFAIDLWSIAVILFIMLVGLPPWEFAREEDPRYRMIMKGDLARMLKSWNREISPQAADLLQQMLREDPRHRLSLEEIKDHEWVRHGETSRSDMSMIPPEEWRR